MVVKADSIDSAWIGFAFIYIWTIETITIETIVTSACVTTVVIGTCSVITAFIGTISAFINISASFTVTSPAVQASAGV